MSRGRFIAFVAGLLLSSCACRDDGAARIGASCEDARDCDTGLCVDTTDGRICTITCTGDEQCPDALTCQRFSLAEEGDAGPIGESVRACAPAVDGG